MESKLLFAAPLMFLAGTLAFPRSVYAQTSEHSWTLCSVGSLRSCSSIQLVTDPIMSGTDRVGTDVTVVMHNLNGQIANDNTIWSGLRFVELSSWGNLGISGYSNALHLNNFPASPLVLDGLATGGAIWQVLSDGVGTAEQPEEMIGGCTFGSLTNTYGVNTTAVMTCGTSATATFSFSTGSFLNAEWMYTGINGYADAGQGPGGFSCISVDPQDPNPPLGGCTMLADTNPFSSVVPEPVTIALLGTGLLGIGAARLRRRKKDGTVDA